MMMTKVVYIISDVDKALAFEWIADNIDKKRFALSFIVLNPEDSALENYLKEKNFEVARVTCNGKKDWLAATVLTYKLLKKWRPHVVHCHLIQANIIGLVAAKLAGIRKRIYTRHHSSLHHVYFKKGVLWDKLANNLASQIIAITGTVKTILLEWEKADARKVILVPHGFKLDAFEQVDQERIDLFKQRYGIEKQRPVVGIISRFTEWKGVQFIIPAFQRFLEDFPDAVLLLLNAQGDFEREIFTFLKSLPSSSFRLIPFEKDIMAAYKCMDVFVHTPIDEHSEAFGQIYVEALAAGVPSVFTLSGIAPDFIEDRNNALVVPFKNSDAIYKALINLSENRQLRQELCSNGMKTVAERFQLQTMITKLEQLYES
jgi:glycosyltransferase involved in cell wall biosynthesis